MHPSRIVRSRLRDRLGRSVSRPRSAGRRLRTTPPGPGGPRSGGFLIAPPSSLGDLIRRSGPLRATSRHGRLQARSLTFEDYPVWRPDLPSFRCLALRDCRLQRPPGDPARALPHPFAPALDIESRKDALGISDAPLESASCGHSLRRLVRSLLLRPSRLLAPGADPTAVARSPPGRLGLLRSDFHRRVAPGAAGCDYGATWGPAPAGLAPARQAVSFAAFPRRSPSGPFPRVAGVGVATAAVSWRRVWIVTMWLVITNHSPVETDARA